jgi:hypothetical protein
MKQADILTVTNLGGRTVFADCANKQKMPSCRKGPRIIFKLLRSPRIDSKEPIPHDCVAWRAGTTTQLLLGF